jgi:YesN/AraC family two-component response regulator
VGEGGSHHEQGTGIGLSLVKDLTELLGGKVEVKSVVGQGSEFSVTIPVHIIKTLGISDVSITPEVSYVIGETIDHDADNGNDARPKILIVEDHEGLRKFIAQTLKDNYEYFEAEDGQKGLDLAMEVGPDLIISDIMMPNMDGVSMLQKIKKDVRTSHIPVILLTAKTVEESKIEALESGADDYLTKPFDQHELIIKVRNTIASRMKLREKIRLDLFREAPKVEAISQDERFLARLKNAIQDHLGDEQLSVDLLAKEIGISRAHFYRKVTALSGQSVNNLIRDFRLQKAKQLLDQHWGSVSQVAYEVGFSNPSYFTKCFKERYGKLPSEYPSEIS